MVALMTRQLQW